jgi:hypothetical protein
VAQQDQQDFWEFALNDDNGRKMDAIAEGARFFKERLEEKAKRAQNEGGMGEFDLPTDIEYEAYPMDTFSVIVSFVVRGVHVSLNLENLRFFTTDQFEAQKRGYIWIDINRERRAFVTVLDDQVTGKPDPWTVKEIFMNMYEIIREKLHYIEKLQIETLKAILGRSINLPPAG